MQTLQRTQTRKQPQLEPGHKPAIAKHAFFAALAVLAVLNLVMMLGGLGKGKRDVNEILQQAQEEVKTGVVSKHSWPWWLCRLYEEQAQAPDVVVFGSSLLGSAHSSVDAQYLSQLIDVLTHRRIAFLEAQISQRTKHPVSVFSLGCPGEMVSDFYVLSKALFSSGKKPQLVVATIAPRDFMDSTLTYPAATDHYRFMSNYLDLNDFNQYAYPDFFSRFGAEIERLPLKHLGKTLWSDHAEHTQNDWNQSEICRIEPGKSVVPAQAVPKRVDNTKEYVERFRNPYNSNYRSEMHFFASWLGELKKQGIAVSIVGMPTTSYNRQLLPPAFWQRYRHDIAAVCKKNGADWMDLSDSGLFTDNDYLDTVHLNAYGAVRLFPVIAERLTLTESSHKALASRWAQK